MSKVVTRFPPSPTGFLHIGGARTALFNWLFARGRGGEFVLRIEDTDQARSTPEMTQAIVDGMTWLGLNWDHGPYLQSDRTELYNQYIERLIASGHAYYCDCTPEAVDAMRETAKAAGKKPKYDGSCRNRNLGPGPGRVVRFRAPEGLCAWADMVKGPMEMDFEEMVDDFVIRRGNGSPMYNLAVVVDDAEMGVTHIIRGEDHLSNTPKQIALYLALGLPVPAFGHLPMIFGPDRKKLSKRHGAMSVMEYEAMGFLPEAVVNYLLRLGWGHGDQELFTRQEMIELFSEKGLGTSPAMFDMAKLEAVSAHYIKEADPARLAGLLPRFLAELGVADPDPARLAAAVPLYQPRAKTLREMAEGMAFFFAPDQALEHDAEALAKFVTPESAPLLEAAARLVEEAPVFEPEPLEESFKTWLDGQGLKFKAVAQPVRVALSGRTFSPGLFEMMLVLGRESTVRRLRRAAALAGA
ncbi:glutamate--tRNA ligase [Desulfocurvus vexinensis]|uniref:glutamate--tRNA ligase n=1 Tax=Desulfocurvus vexinensis TaxID=399548 RepID=UPI0004914C3C|nr:glutamate--tRNA ligase [Desulfocurvus vexinensis]